ATASIFLGGRHAEHAKPSQARDDVRGDVRIPVNGGRVDLLRAKVPHIGNRLANRFALLRSDLEIGENQWSVEMAKEQAFAETDPLRSREYQPFGLFNLLFPLLCSEGHAQSS